MRRSFLSLVVGLLTLAFSSAYAQSQRPATVGQYILLSDAETLKEAKEELSSQGGQVLRRLEFASGLVAALPARVVQRLQRNHPKLAIVDDIKVHLIEPLAKPANPGGGKDKDTTPPPQEIPWGIRAIGADVSHATYRGAGITVCVVDTGIDKEHSDLAANIIGGRNFTVKKGGVDPNAWDDDNGHGSHVAGTVAAVDNSIGVIGVAPDAKLYGVKVLDRRGSGTLSGVVDGINECINAGTHVINMSLGAKVSPTSSSGLLMQAAVDAAHNAGMEVVVAAGNDGDDIANYIPAGLQNLIAVAAVDESMKFPYWSNYGLSLKDFSAPGVAVHSTWKDGAYNTISGTSMASPHVAGVAALKMAAGLSAYTSIDLGAPISIQGAGLITAP